MNDFGKIFRFTTFGESHGKAIGCILDGVPAGIKIDEKFIQSQLDRRKPGKSKLETAMKEDDKVEEKTSEESKEDDAVEEASKDETSKEEETKEEIKARIKA